MNDQITDEAQIIGEILLSMAHGHRHAQDQFIESLRTVLEADQSIPRVAIPRLLYPMKVFLIVSKDGSYDPHPEFRP